MSEQRESTPAGSERPPPPAVKEKTDYTIAYISAGSALLGAVVGAVASYFIATTQLSVQGQQSRDDFLRTQRQSAYAKFLADVPTYDESVNHCNQLQTDLPNQTATYRVLYGDLTQLQIVASDQGRADATAYGAAISHVGADCSQLYDLGQEAKSPTQASQITTTLGHYNYDFQTTAVSLENKLLGDGRSDIASH